MEVQIKLDEKRLKEIQRMLREIPNGMPKVMSRAINKTATSVRAKVVKDIAVQVGLKQKAIRSRISIHKASWKQWAASVNISRKRIGLIHFGARQTKKGVSHMLDKNKGRQKIEHAFITAMPTGHTGVFMRKEQGGERVPRLPIRELWGRSLGFVFKDSPFLVAKTYSQAQETLNKNIEAQMAYIMGKFRKAA